MGMSIQETTKGLARATLYVACLSIGSLNLLAETKTVKMVQTTETQAQILFDQAVTDFRMGLFEESAAKFDKVAMLLPKYAPQLWQRGIVLYYVGRYNDCRKQFESHRTVNPNDVENAAWHFLCVAHSESFDKAEAALLPVGYDRRLPMQHIYEMLKGSIDPTEVLEAAGMRPNAQFYAHLYVGLYFEALGNTERAREHITVAAHNRYASTGGYMYMVARLHSALP